jgi:choline dehydrogenase-like flavoprotein
LAPEWKHNKFYDHRYHYHNPQVSANGICVAGQFVPTESTQREEELLNSCVWLYSELPGERTGPGEALIRAKHRLLKKDKPGYSIAGDLAMMACHPLETAGNMAAHYYPHPVLMRCVRLMTIVEPTPDPESRVTLSTERDRLGMPRVRVNWRLDHRVRHTFDRTAALLRDALEASGVARVVLDPPILGGEWPATFEREGTWHHMGTTRMHESPRQGVVDPDCRVHGMGNLYIAGSSVFPTAGANYPSLTLVALATRLADHLVEELETQISVRKSQVTAQ